MPAPAWEDLDEFLDLDEFAIQVTVQLQNGSTLNPVGIYDDPYMNAELGEYDMDNARPRFTCKQSAVQGVTRGDTLTLPDGTVLDIMTAPQPDGTGMAMLDLAPQG